MSIGSIIRKRVLDNLVTINETLSALLPEAVPLRRVGGLEIEYNERLGTATIRHIDEEEGSILIRPDEIMDVTETLLSIQTANMNNAEK